MRESVMIIYDPRLNPSFEDFGLSIPLDNSRWERTFQELEQSVAHFDRYIHRGPWREVQKEDLLLAHTKDYIEQLFCNPDPWVYKAYQGEDYFVLPQKRPFSEMLERAVAHIRGTLTACEEALDSGWAYFMGGGMHHALSFTGQGFCLLNDVVLSLRILQEKKRIKRALVIDVDIHKGDGTSEITREDDSIYTVSFHGARTWPLEGGFYRESLIPSNCDRPIRNSQEYLPTLERTLAKLPQDFDLCLVVQGADPFEEDELPSARELNLTLAQMLKRDQMISSLVALPRYCPGLLYGRGLWAYYLESLYSISPLGARPF